MTTMATKTRLPPHRHAPAPGEPADWRGRQVCSGLEGCGLLGQAGDARHPVAAPPLSAARAAARISPDLAAASRARDAAILGETGDLD